MAKMKMSDVDREQRRLMRHVRIDTRVDYYEKELTKGVKATMSTRVRVAAQLLRDKTVANISKPVRKLGRGRVDPNSRSKEGEFPRADTTRLMKDIFVKTDKGGKYAQVGTTLKYGLLLETKMQRSFLRRTFNEFRPQLARILGTNVGGRFRKL